MSRRTLWTLICLLNLIGECACGNLTFSLKRRRVKINNETSPLLRAVFGQRILGRDHNTLYEDTGSSILWVPMKNCKNKGKLSQYCKSKRSLYDPHKSRTAKDLKKLYHVQYGIGDTVGFVYEDVFAFGDPRTKQQLKLKKPVQFGGAARTVDGDQGILGLTYTRKTDAGSSIFGEAVNQGILDRPLFSIYLRRCSNGKESCTDAGQLTLGAHDNHNCEKIIDWVNLRPDVTDWEFMMEGFSMGPQFQIKKPIRCITDTGSSHIFMPPQFSRLIAAFLKANRTEEDDDLIVPCNYVVNFQLKINGREYQIPSKQLVERTENNTCMLLISENGDDGNDDLWILGDPFIRTFCQISSAEIKSFFPHSKMLILLLTIISEKDLISAIYIHDWKNRRVGFARAR